MTVEIADIRQGIAANLATLGTGQQVSPYPKQAPTPPALQVVGFDSIERTAFGRGSFGLPFQVQGLAGMATEEGAHVRLDKWLSPTATLSVWAALESDQTLGGIVDNLVVLRCDGSQILQVQPGVEMLGSTWHLQIEL